jgi:hypothetical protein
VAFCLKFDTLFSRTVLLILLEKYQGEKRFLSRLLKIGEGKKFQHKRDVCELIVKKYINQISLKKSHNKLK